MRRYRLSSHAKYDLKVHLTSGTITDEMINEYINEQEGEVVQDDSRFEIDLLNPSPYRRGSLCAGHVRQLGGASPPPNLMEVKG